MTSSAHSGRYRAVLGGALLVLAYVAFGRLGLLLAVPPGYATAIFPPAGLAVGAMFLFGAETLPATFAGSFLLNLWIGVQNGHRIGFSAVMGAVIIASASALQAGVGGSALRRAVGYPAPLDDARDIARFLLLAPVICLVSSTVSLAGLSLIGAVTPAELPSSWMAWWTGDTLGVLIVLPLMLVVVGEPRVLWRRRARYVAAPMLLFFALFVVIYVRVSAWEDDQSLLEFRLDAQYLADAMRTSLDEQSTVLDQLKASFVSRQMPITRPTFAALTAVLLQRFPTIQAVEWAPRVAARDRASFEVAQQSSFPSFAIRERDRSGALNAAGPRRQYFPVTFLNPLRGNESAAGFDLASDSNRSRAIDAAMATGQVRATAPVRLVQERGRESGILLTEGIASGATGPGVVLIVLRMGTFMQAQLGALSSSIEARLTDSASVRPLFDSLVGGQSPTLVRPFEFGGRHYVLEAAPTALYLAQHRGWESWSLLVAGVFGTGLIGALLMLGTGEAWRFEALLDARTRDLKFSHQRLMQEMDEREQAQAALAQAQRMKAIGQLTGGIAHDFNNLLMIVSGSVERLRRDIAGAKTSKYLDMIGQAAQRAESLTRQLLSFAQIRPLKPRVVDAVAAVHGTSEMIRQSLRADIEVRIETPEDVCAIEIDPGEFELAVLNLAVNARDAMPNGGVLTVSVAPVTVDPPIDGVSGPCFAVRVADSGVGIAADVLPRVFEPFFTTKETGKGTGLGLSHVYGFAKQSGGTATIASAAGQGTTVTLLLPASNKAPMAAEPDTAPQPSLQPVRARALVVEDNPEVADILVAQLEELGYSVERKDDGRAALEALADGATFDIVVSDILMPGGVNGVDVARDVRIRARETAVLLITGYGGSDVDPASEGFAVLRKPFDTEALARALSEVRRTRDRQRDEERKVRA